MNTNLSDQRRCAPVHTCGLRLARRCPRSEPRYAYITVQMVFSWKIVGLRGPGSWVCNGPISGCAAEFEFDDNKPSARLGPCTGAGDSYSATSPTALRHNPRPISPSWTNIRCRFKMYTKRDRKALCDGEVARQHMRAVSGARPMKMTFGRPGVKVYRREKRANLSLRKP